jgi:hypothetical protein
MKTEIQNLIEMDESLLFKKYYQVKPLKNEYFKENDLVLIKKYGNTLTLAKLSKACSLVRKHMDVTLNPPCYRKDNK